MPFAVTSDDVQARWRALTVAEEAKATVLIEDALGLIRGHIPLLEPALDDDEVSNSSIVPVVVAAVLRVMRNPEGYREIQTGPYSVTLDRDMVSGSVFFTEAELDYLTGLLGGGTGSAFTITPYGEPWPAETT